VNTSQSNIRQPSLVIEELIQKQIIVAEADFKAKLEIEYEE
jgi:hypothetical protein